MHAVEQSDQTRSIAETPRDTVDGPIQFAISLRWLKIVKK
jgi:hypothetical protein